MGLKHNKQTQTNKTPTKKTKTKRKPFKWEAFPSVYSKSEYHHQILRLSPPKRAEEQENNKKITFMLDCRIKYAQKD